MQRMMFAVVFAVIALVGRGEERRWVQFIFDFRDDAQVVRMTNLVATAKAHGYTGVLLASGCELGQLHVWEAPRLGRLRAVKRAIDAAGLETAVGVWSFGYAKECFLPIEPNLVAAAPVADTRYRVKDGRCVWLPRPSVKLLAQTGFLHSPRQNGDVADVRQPVTPHRSYRLRIVARAEGTAAEWPISVSVRRTGAKDDCLETRVFKLKTGGGLQTNDLFFASLAETALDIQCRGYNRVFAGRARIEALELAETEPRVVVRRSGTPIAVSNRTSGVVCREGVDFACVPKAKSVWPGPWVKPFELKILPGSAIREGDELAVDAYAPFPTWGRWQSACMSTPEAFAIMEASAKAIARELDPRVWILSFDEVRAGGGCANCRAIGDMAHVYAAAVRRSMGIVRAVRPEAEIYLWNDMVDPFYLKDDGKNAGLYSTMKGVWDLLPSDLGIAYWTYACREKGVDFFARRNRKLLLCAYYDEKKLSRSLDWMDLARRTPGVTGIMYCTWGNNWDLLGEFGDRVGHGSSLQARIDATPGGVVDVPAGEYALVKPLVITNGCSLRLHKNATLRAVRTMDALVKIDLSSVRGRDLGVFYSGGVLDGNGLSSCLTIDGFHHPTLRDTVFRNGKDFGVWVGGAGKGGCELIADNLYFQCTQHGLAGNTALRLNISDCHFTDIVIVDWTVGIDVASGGANRFTRCHVWGGGVRTWKDGAPVCEMLENSVCFRIGKGACNMIFRDCYADTGKTGFENAGWETSFFGCSYFNNYKWCKLDDVTVVRQTGGSMRFIGGFIQKSCPKLKVYEGTGNAYWKDMCYSRFGRDANLPGVIQSNVVPSEYIDLGR